MNEPRTAVPQRESVPHEAPAPQTGSGERTYATFIHLTLLGFHVMPLVLVVGPLVMWLIKRHESPFIDDHGREAVNFHLSLLLYSLILVPVVGILTCGVGFVLYAPVYLLGLIGTILAAIAANKGEYYRYPATLRIIH